MGEPSGIKSANNANKKSTRSAPNDIDSLMPVIELLFFAYRDFVSEPDEILHAFGFGRAHHRVLHFVNRQPGLRVADLLDILKITKQSLARVLKQLVEEGFIEQHAGSRDRRERHLFVTDKGAKLAQDLSKPQLKRIAEALEKIDEEHREAIKYFLYSMITNDDKIDVSKLLGTPLVYTRS